jgi:hypothetical protein
MREFVGTTYARVVLQVDPSESAFYRRMIKVQSHQGEPAMFRFLKGRCTSRKAAKVRLGVEMLDDRVVPATTSFDPRLLLARGAAERAISGGAFSPSLNAFNAFNRFVNTFERLEAQAQTRLNRIANTFADRVNGLNAQLIGRVLADANDRLGDFGGVGQLLPDGAVLRQLTEANAGITFTPGVGFVTTAPLGDFGGVGQLLPGGAFTRRFEAQVNRLNTQLTNQFRSLNRLVTSQLNRLENQVVRAGAPFSSSFNGLRDVFTSQLSTANQALRQGLSGTGSLFNDTLTNFNTVIQNPDLVTAGFNQFTTDLGGLVGQLNNQFSTGLFDFNTAFSNGFADFDQNFSSGLGTFFDDLNSQFITPSPGFGLPTTGVTLVPNPGLFPGGIPTTTTTTA